MKKILSTIIASAVLVGGAFAADLTIDARWDITGKDPAASYFTFKSVIASVEKDQVDAVTGASKADGTEKWNYLRRDPKNGTNLPGGFQSLVKFPLSSAAQHAVDVPTAKKNADGSITIQYVHRGTAYILTTDATGKFQFPNGNFKKRTIAVLVKDANVVSKDFAADGTVATLDWAKVWDNAIADGKVIVEGNAAKTSKVVDDLATSTLYVYEGAVQVTLDGNILTFKGELNALNK